jgi:hypothetical protein
MEYASLTAVNQHVWLQIGPNQELASGYSRNIVIAKECNPFAAKMDGK